MKRIAKFKIITLNLVLLVAIYLSFISKDKYVDFWWSISICIFSGILLSWNSTRIENYNK